MRGFYLPSSASPADFAPCPIQSSTVSDKRKADQKTVDAGLMAAIAAEPLLKAYLNAKFSLKKGDRPHEMLF